MHRILVVEDEMLVAFALSEGLQDLGAQVTLADTAEQALEAMLTTAFAAAIIDIGLPGLRGDQFARECRARFPRMPIVLATGMHEHEIRALFASDPHLAVIEKPHEFSVIQAALEELGIAFSSRTTHA